MAYDKGIDSCTNCGAHLGSLKGSKVGKLCPLINSQGPITRDSCDRIMTNGPLVSLNYPLYVEHVTRELQLYQF